MTFKWTTTLEPSCLNQSAPTNRVTVPEHRNIWVNVSHFELCTTLILTSCVSRLGTGEIQFSDSIRFKSQNLQYSNQWLSTFLVPQTPQKVSLILQTPSPKLSQIVEPLSKTTFSRNTDKKGTYLNCKDLHKDYGKL